MSHPNRTCTQSQQRIVTIRCLSRYETMLRRSDFFVIFIEGPMYHCTLGLSLEIYH